MELPIRYPYNPKWRTVVVGVVFFGLGSLLMAHKASGNSAGVIINGILTLDAHGATIFYWAISTMSAVFVAFALWLGVLRILSPQFLQLGTEAMLLPHGRFRMRVSRIPYADIQDVSEVDVFGQEFVYVMFEGRRFGVAASLLPDAESFATVREFLLTYAQP